jgi:hypothetical protein
MTKFSWYVPGMFHGFGFGAKMNERRPNAAGRHGGRRGRGRHIRGRHTRRGRRSPSATLAMTQEETTTVPNCRAYTPGTHARKEEE